MSEIDDIIASQKVDQKRLDFVLEFILNARRSGRGQDLGRNSESQQNELVVAANSLYDKAVASCTTPKQVP